MGGLRVGGGGDDVAGGWECDERAVGKGDYWCGGRCKGDDPSEGFAGSSRFVPLR